MPILTFFAGDNTLASQLRETIAANKALDKALPLLEPLSPEARAWVLRKLGEKLEIKGDRK